MVFHQEDWQPIDILEKALTAVANECSPSKGLPPASRNKQKAVVRQGGKGSGSEERIYLAEGVDFVNPEPRTRSLETRKKWPENARWVCTYCRRIFTILKSYKEHLKVVHRKGTRILYSSLFDQGKITPLVL